ncbi:MAG: hypothetical protein J6C62_00880 [Clostridia bacterium]|nr:hypothetical protein [Clostridia bacterium]
MKRHYLDEINKVEINLSTNETENYPFEADESTILRAASILTNKILDFANQGGDIKNITPKTLFGNKEEL